MGLYAVLVRATYHLSHINELPTLLMRPKVLVLAALPSVAYAITVPLVKNPKSPPLKLSEETAVKLTQFTLLTQFAANLPMPLILAPGSPAIEDVLIGMLLLDTVEYFMHRACHSSRTLYSLAHATHHSISMKPELAMYNSSVEAGFVGSMVLLVFAITDIGFSSFIVVQTLASVKTVWDHSQYSKHHLQHHLQPFSNYEQPFFDIWDRLLGTKEPMNVPSSS